VLNGAPTAPLDAALAASGSGVGLLGLRQRVELLGGTFEAGPRSDGGFELYARLGAAKVDSPAAEPAR
jgi:signal transduction histidine kinase